MEENFGFSKKKVKKENITYDDIFLNPQTEFNRLFRLQTSSSQTEYNRLFRPQTSSSQTEYNRLFRPQTSSSQTEYNRLFRPQTSSSQTEFNRLFRPSQKQENPSIKGQNPKINNPFVTDNVIDDVIMTMKTKTLTKEKKISMIKDRIQDEVKEKLTVWSLLSWVKSTFRHVAYMGGYLTLAGVTMAAFIGYHSSATWGDYLKFLLNYGINFLPEFVMEGLQNVGTNLPMTALSSVGIYTAFELAKRYEPMRKFLNKKVPMGYFDTIFEKVGINPKTITVEQICSTLLSNLVSVGFSVVFGTSFLTAIYNIGFGVGIRGTMTGISYIPGVAYNVGTYTVDKGYSAVTASSSYLRTLMKRKGKEEKIISEYIENDRKVQEKFEDYLLNPSNKKEGNVAIKLMSIIEENESKEVKEHFTPPTITKEDHEKIMRKIEKEESQEDIENASQARQNDSLIESINQRRKLQIEDCRENIQKLYYEKKKTIEKINHLDSKLKHTLGKKLKASEIKKKKKEIENLRNQQREFREKYDKLNKILEKLSNEDARLMDILSKSRNPVPDILKDLASIRQKKKKFVNEQKLLVDKYKGFKIEHFLNKPQQFSKKLNEDEIVFWSIDAEITKLRNDIDRNESETKQEMEILPEDYQPLSLSDREFYLNKFLSKKRDLEEMSRSVIDPRANEVLKSKIEECNIIIADIEHIKSLSHEKENIDKNLHEINDKLVNLEEQEQLLKKLTVINTSYLDEPVRRYKREEKKILKEKISDGPRETSSIISPILSKMNSFVGAAVVTTTLVAFGVSQGNVESISAALKEFGMNEAVVDLTKLGADFIISSDIIKGFLLKESIDHVGVGNVIKSFSEFLSPGDEKEVQTLYDALKMERDQTTVRSIYNKMFGKLIGGYYSPDYIKKCSWEELRNMFKFHYPDQSCDNLDRDLVEDYIIRAQSKRISILKSLISNAINSALMISMTQTTQNLIDKIHIDMPTQKIIPQEVISTPGPLISEDVSIPRIGAGTTIPLPYREMEIVDIPEQFPKFVEPNKSIWTLGDLSELRPTQGPFEKPFDWVQPVEAPSQPMSFPKKMDLSDLRPTQGPFEKPFDWVQPVEAPSQPMSFPKKMDLSDLRPTQGPFEKPFDWVQPVEAPSQPMSFPTPINPSVIFSTATSKPIVMTQDDIQKIMDGVKLPVLQIDPKIVDPGIRVTIPSTNVGGTNIDAPSIETPSIDSPNLNIELLSSPEFKKYLEESLEGADVEVATGILAERIGMKLVNYLSGDVVTMTLDTILGTWQTAKILTKIPNELYRIRQVLENVNKGNLNAPVEDLPFGGLHKHNIPSPKEFIDELTGLFGKPAIRKLSDLVAESISDIITLKGTETTMNDILLDVGLRITVGEELAKLKRDIY
jgi:hypothetical protein